MAKDPEFINWVETAFLRALLKKVKEDLARPSLFFKFIGKDNVIVPIEDKEG